MTLEHVLNTKCLLHPLHVVLNCPLTADMIFITASGTVSFYPDLTRNYHMVKTMTREGVPLGQWLGSIGGNRFDVHSNMTFLNGPCNALCPALWHHVSNHQEYAVVDWDQRFSVKSMLYNNNVEWHLNDCCFNLKCLFNIDVMVENQDVPPKIMPYSLQSVREQSKQIKDHEPVKTQYQYDIHNAINYFMSSLMKKHSKVCYMQQHVQNPSLLMFLFKMVPTSSICLMSWR